MGRPRKPDPLKYCASCGSTLTRKTYNGTLESMNTFLRRKYCDAACMGRAMVKPTVTMSGLRQRSHREAPLGAACRDCGATANLGRHHLDENPANNDPANVATLCASCHTRLHWATGKRWPHPRKRCSVCGVPASRRGYCQKHWFRFSKYGNPLLTKKRCGRRMVLTAVSEND